MLLQVSAINSVGARNLLRDCQVALATSTHNSHAPGSLTRGDHKGCSDSVEQAHCTLGAVKRYRALSEGGGLPNFWFHPHDRRRSNTKAKVKNPSVLYRKYFLVVL